VGIDIGRQAQTPRAQFGAEVQPPERDNDRDGAQPSHAHPVITSNTTKGRAGIALAASSSLVSSRDHRMGDTGTRQPTSEPGTGTSSPTKMEPFQ
jgi:hypothetical protein